MWNVLLQPDPALEDVVWVDKRLQGVRVLRDAWTTWDMQVHNKSQVTVWAEARDIVCEDVPVEETYPINNPLMPGYNACVDAAVRVLPRRTSKRHQRLTEQRDHLQLSFNLCFWKEEPTLQQKTPIQIVPTMCWLYVPPGFPLRFGLQFDLRWDGVAAAAA
jgi:hypothetical protein